MRGQQHDSTGPTPGPTRTTVLLFYRWPLERSCWPGGMMGSLGSQVCFPRPAQRLPGTLELCAVPGLNGLS